MSRLITCSILHNRSDAMGRVFITGDTHRQFHRLKNFCNQVDTSTEDIMIILGDVGLN